MNNMIDLHCKIPIYWILAYIFLSIGYMPYANSQSFKALAHPVELLVLKSPTCGCCSKWIDHLDEENIIAHPKDIDDMSIVKNKFNIKPSLRSCHTAITKEGFVFEGHVPAKFIKKFLTEKPENAIGLSVPAMPLGSPGMEMGDKFMPYNVLLLNMDGTSSVYQKINQYSEQF